MSKIIIATAEMVKAFEDYMASVKLGEAHAARFHQLAKRIHTLSELHSEMYAALLIEQESAKEIIESTDEPEPRAYTQFMEHYMEFKVVQKLFQEAVKEAESEKAFIDWHFATTVQPEHEKALKLLEGK